MSAPTNVSADKPVKRPTRLFLCGDVMTGRGIDQILRQPCDPVLHENGARSALDYLHLAEDANGPIPRGVGPSYVWGSALEELDRMRPDLRIINLETSITRSVNYEPKGINYRMSPENADCLKAADIDCCVLGNNHVLDWGCAGLLDTLDTLDHLQIKAAGAGRSLAGAGAPAVLEASGGGRVLVFSFASVSSGVPRDWEVTAAAPGVNLLSHISKADAVRIAEEIVGKRRVGDLVVVSVHWGPNWGYEILEQQRRFAHTLIDKADVSVVHGHSSHHPKAIEVYRNRLILYGCGDFLNDYEGIGGYEEYRDDLVLMYFADFDPGSREMCGLEMVPLQIRRFQLARPTTDDIRWMQRTLNQKYADFELSVTLRKDGHFVLSWTRDPPAMSMGSAKDTTDL